MKTKKHTATMTRYTPDSSLNDQSSSVPSTEGTQKPTEEAPLKTPGGSSSQEGRQYQASAQLSGKQLETATKPAEVWWLARLKEHPFKAFSLAVSVYGGLILLAFFTHLGSMPDLDLAGATATVAAVAVIGLLVIFTLGGSTIAAGVVTRSLASYVPHLASLRSLMFLAAPGGIFIAAVVVSVISEKTLSTTCWIWFTLALSFFVPALGCWYQQQNKSVFEAEPGVESGAQCKSPSEGGAKSILENGNAAARRKEPETWEEYVAYLASGFIWLVSAMMAFVTYEALTRQSNVDSLKFAAGLGGWGVISILLNMVVVRIPQKAQIPAFIASGAAAVLILTMLTSAWMAIPVAVVRTLGLGEIPVGVVLTPEGCETFNKSARGQQICQLDADKKLGWACPVILKSRIGAPMVFELASFGDDGRWPIWPAEIEKGRLGGSVGHLRYQRIQVAKSEVRSWPSVTPFVPSEPKESGQQPAQDAGPAEGGGTRGEAGGDVVSKQANLSPLVSYLNLKDAGLSDAQRQWLARQCGPALNSEAATPPKAIPNRTAPIARKANTGKES